MRRVYVSAPKLGTRVELSKRQKAVHSAADARSSWDRYRRSAKSRDVVSVLKEAAGIRMRCFYCSDSAAADVDHFMPISINFNNTFRWKNFIWVCPVCNRYKGSKFPCDSADAPLLINPTRDDPWRYLILDTDTGVLAPRFRVDGYDTKATATLDILKPINYEASIEGRNRTIIRLREAASRIPAGASASKSVGQQLKKLLNEVRQDDHGVSAWFAFWEGRSEKEFQELSERNQDTWRHFVRYCARVRYGV